MIEVEVKAKINDFEEIRSKLNNMDAIKLDSEHQEDIYFNAPHKDFKITDEALRIRKITKNNQNFEVITYKGAKIDKSSKTRREIEVKIEDYKKFYDIFECLDFKASANVIKYREIFEIDNLIISLDDVKGLDPYMEIEISLEDGSDYDDALNKIFEMFKTLGIQDGFERTSYLELLENKKIN